MTQHRILYLGNFASEHSTENHLLETLRDMHHIVYPIQENSPRPAQDAADLIAGLSPPPDLVLYTRTWDFAGASQLWQTCRARGIATATVHLDLFFGVHREHLVRENPMFRTQHCFTADGGHQTEFAEAGVNHHFLPPGVLKRYCYLGVPNDRDRCDVLFVGSPQPPYHPEWPWRGQLLDALRQKYGTRFAHRGVDQDRVRGPALNNLYASAKVVVGDSLMLSPMYWSDRVPETLGRGGVLATTCIDDETFMAIGASVGDAPFVAFRPHDTGYALAEIDAMLTWDAAYREEFRQDAVKEVLDVGTYHSRMRTMLAVIFGDDNE